MEIKQSNYTEHVQSCIQQLCTSQDDKIISDNAKNLFKFGIWIRSNTLPRGSIFIAAGPRLKPSILNKIAQHLNSTAISTRSNIAMALGEWGGNELASIIARKIPQEQDEQILDFYAGSLGTIGGLNACNGFSWILKNSQDENLKDNVIGNIQDLITGCKLCDIEPSDWMSEYKQSVIRENKELEIFAQAPEKLRSQRRAKRGLVDALDFVSEDPNLPNYLRDKAWKRRQQLVYMVGI